MLQLKVLFKITKYCHAYGLEVINLKTVGSVVPNAYIVLMWLCIYTVLCDILCYDYIDFVNEI